MPAAVVSHPQTAHWQRVPYQLGFSFHNVSECTTSAAATHAVAPPSGATSKGTAGTTSAKLNTDLAQAAKVNSSSQGHTARYKGKAPKAAKQDAYAEGPRAVFVDLSKLRAKINTSGNIIEHI